MSCYRPKGLGAVTALLAAGAVATGCAPRVSRVQLSPVARGSETTAYVQVREMGSAPSRLWFWSGSSWRFGVTIDAINRSPLSVTLALAGAHLELQTATGGPTVVRVLAAGPGGLPSRIAGDAQEIAPLTLASGESRTVWLVFDTVAPFPQNPRMTLLVPASGPAPPEIKVTLRAPSEPTWIPAPARAVGWGIHSRLEGRVYGADGYEFGLDAGLWIARRPFRADLCLRLGDLFPATADGLAHGSAVGFTGSGTWYPFGLPGGIYGEAGLSRVHFPDTAAPFEDHWSPFAGGGIELGTQPGATSATYLRLGYVHSFRSPTPLTDGFLVAWGGSFEL